MIPRLRSRVLSSNNPSMGRRKLVVIKPGDEEFVTIKTGGPTKYLRHRKVRKLFVNKAIYAYPPVESDFLQAFREEVKLARYRHHLSQAGLAKLVHTTQSEISQLELGKSNPTVKFVERVAHELGLKISANIK